MNDLDQSAKDTILHPGLFTYLGVLGISLWGGVTSALQSKEPFSWRSFTANILSSSFAGMLAGFVSQYVSFPAPLAWAAIGVASYMGTPALIGLAMKLRLVRKLLTEKDIE